MAHPIAGTGQYPFQIGGFLVDSAKIDGRTFSKELYIHKQSSSFMFDLIEATTGEIFKDVNITWVDEEGKPLNYNDTSLYIANLLPERTFARKVQSVKRDIYGFLVMIHENKVKVSTGDYIFYDRDYDLSLVGVTLTPQTIVIKKGENATFTPTFFPGEYPNKSGTWTSKDPKIARSSSQQPTAQDSYSFTGMEVGETPVFFIPDANSTLVAGGYIYVLPADENPNLEQFKAMMLRQRRADPYQFEPTNRNVYAGGEFTVKLVFFPENYVPTEECQLVYNGNIVEYLGTDDFINYKFKTSGSMFSQQINITFTINDEGRTLSSSVYGLSYGYDSEMSTLGMSDGCRVGQTIYAHTAASEYAYNWTSSDESILSVVSPGTFKGIKEGIAVISALRPSGTKKVNHTVKVSNKCADYITINEYNEGVIPIGSTKQFTLKVEPPECAQYYPSNWTVGFGGSCNDISITPDGLLTVNAIESWPRDYAVDVFLKPLSDETLIENPLTGPQGRGINIENQIQVARRYGYSNRPASDLIVYSFYDNIMIETGETRFMMVDVIGFGETGKPPYSISYTIEGESFTCVDPYDGANGDLHKNASLYVTGIKPGRGSINFELLYDGQPPVYASSKIIVY